MLQVQYELTLIERISSKRHVIVPDDRSYASDNK